MDVIAHRGASAHAPEHTTQAYDLALEMGSDVLELDIRTTADGTPVVLHDPTLARTAGDPRPVVRVTDRQLAALDPAVRPLALEAVFARYGARTRYLVEIKQIDPVGEQALIALIARHGLAGHVTIQSFRRTILRRVGALDPALPLAPLFTPWTTSGHIRRRLDRIARYACGISPCATSVDAPLVLAAQARGLAVRVYTVNDEPQMQRLLGLGVDGIITDVPDRLGAVLAVTAGPPLAPVALAA